MRYIDKEIWNAVRLKQDSSDALIRKAEESSLVKLALTTAISKSILRYLVRQAVQKEVKRYLAHAERIREFKRRRRWPAV